MPSTSRITRLQSMLDHYLRVTIQDERTFIGKMIAFDRHLNIVLSDCEEFRKIKSTGKTHGPETEEKRALGLILLRGEVILTLKVEAPPPSSDKKTAGPLGSLSGGPGLARGVGRGVLITPTGIPPMSNAIGLTAPVRGIGTPMPSAMNPQVSGRGMLPTQHMPIMMGRGQSMGMGMGMMSMPQMMPMQPRLPIGIPHTMGPPPSSVPGMMPPPSFGRGIPMPDSSQQGFHPMQMPKGFVPGASGGPPPIQMNVMNNPQQMGYPPNQQYRSSPQSPIPPPNNSRPPPSQQ